MMLFTTLQLTQLSRADSAQSPRKFDYHFHHRVEGICGMMASQISSI